MLDDLVNEIAESGWLFNNCYQREDGSWRGNLRRLGTDGSWFTEWAVGPTFAEMLISCMNKMTDAEFSEDRKASYTIDKSPIVKAPQEANQLLLSLGLVKPPTPIQRRI